MIAESLQAEQQWQNSEPVLKRALELDARNPTALYLMGRMLVVFKRYQESEPYLKLATEVSPRAFQPFNLLGRTYLALDRFEEAEVTYEQAAAVASPGDRKQLAGIYGFEGVGDGYMKAKKKPSAARAYNRALGARSRKQAIWNRNLPKRADRTIHVLQIDLRLSAQSRSRQVNSIRSGSLS